MKTTFHFIPVILLLSISSLSVAQTITIGNPVTTNSIIANIKNNDVISKTIQASGHIEFASKSGYVRILLSNNFNYDLLIYESIPLLANKGMDIFNNVAIETINIPKGFDFSKIRVEIKNARLNKLIINISNKAISDSQLRSERANKIVIINNYLRTQNALWTAIQGEKNIKYK
jgi:hypothetical protein